MAEPHSGNPLCTESRFKAFLGGACLPIRGVSFLLTHRGLKRYAILPFMVNMVLYFFVFCLFIYLLWSWEPKPAAWDFWGPIGGWLAAGVNRFDWLLKLAAFLLAVVFSFLSFTGIGMVIASPFNDLLSEKVIAARLGRCENAPPAGSFALGAVLRNVGHSLLNLLLQLLFTLPTLPCLLIPVIGFLPLLLISGWFAGFGFIDIAMAGNSFRIRHKRMAAGKLFWRILGFGLAMQVCFAIPLAGLLLLPVGVTAGSLAYGDEDWAEVFATSGAKEKIRFQ
ncbi:MAG: EI24 domain-containing protein [Planctomycetota bacterium]|jgi:CysZ protein|nr:EI24 domain-containing protein [Planctomycetota bacterium]